MKNSVIKSALFFVLSIVLLGMVSCSNTAPSNNASVPSNNTQSTNNTPATTNNNTSSTTSSSSNSEYPPVAQSIMQANLESANGGNFKLEDKKGKVVLINLWGVWCQPCIKEMPHLIELQDKYKAQGFEIIGLNVGDENGDKESAENIKKFSEKMKLNYELGWADEKIYSDLLKISKFGGVPQSFLINREGRLNGVFLGGSPATIDKLKDTLNKIMPAN